MPWYHYKEGRARASGVACRDCLRYRPYSAPSAGVVETGAQVNLYADTSHAYHAETTVHYTIASQPSSIPTGTTPTTQSPVFTNGTSIPLNLSEPAYLYQLRAISTHRIHLPSDEYAPVFHTKVALGTPSLSPAGSDSAGESNIYELAVTVNATVPAPVQSVDAENVQLRYTMTAQRHNKQCSSLPSASPSPPIQPQSALPHPLYASEEVLLHFVEISTPAQSFRSPRSRVQCARHQLAAFFRLDARVRVSSFTCSPPRPYQTARQRPDGNIHDAMPLTTRATFTLCAYVKQIGYIRSAYSRAMFVVRPWAQTVSIQSSANVTSAISPHVGALTLTMSSEAGATIWFTLEPPRVNGTLCNAVAQAARIAPNLTLAANDNWQNYLDTHSVTSAPCTGEMATRCQTEPTDCWCVATSRTHTMSLTFCLSSQVRVHG